MPMSLHWLKPHCPPKTLMIVDTQELPRGWQLVQTHAELSLP